MSAKRRINQYTAQEVRALLQADDANSFSKKKENWRRQNINGVKW